jgi:hypothetical protein
MDTTKLEPLLQGPLEATGLFVEFFGTTLRHGTYLKLKTDRISNDLDDVVEDDIIVGRIISTSVSGGNKGNSGHPDVAKVNIFRVAKASGSRSPPPPPQHLTMKLILFQSWFSLLDALKLERKTLKILPSF